MLERAYKPVAHLASLLHKNRSAHYLLWVLAGYQRLAFVACAFVWLDEIVWLIHPLQRVLWIQKSFCIAKKPDPKWGSGSVQIRQFYFYATPVVLQRYLLMSLRVIWQMLLLRSL